MRYLRHVSALQGDTSPCAITDSPVLDVFVAPQDLRTMASACAAEILDDLQLGDWGAKLSIGPARSLKIH